MTDTITQVSYKTTTGIPSTVLLDRELCVNEVDHAIDVGFADGVNRRLCPTDTSGLVPYTGASGDVNLGAHNLTCATLNYTTLNPAPSGITANQKLDRITFTFGDGSAVPPTGDPGMTWTCPFNGTIVGWYLSSSVSGSCAIDIWKAAGAIPTVSNTIVASAAPALSTAQVASSSTLTGWTTAVSAGDVFKANFNSVTSCLAITLVLVVSKT